MLSVFIGQNLAKKYWKKYIKCSFLHEKNKSNKKMSDRKQCSNLQCISWSLLVPWKSAIILMLKSVYIHQGASGGFKWICMKLLCKSNYRGRIRVLHCLCLICSDSFFHWVIFKTWLLIITFIITIISFHLDPRRLGIQFVETNGKKIYTKTLVNAI